MKPDQNKYLSLLQHQLPEMLFKEHVIKWKNTGRDEQFNKNDGNTI